MVEDKPTWNPETMAILRRAIASLRGAEGLPRFELSGANLSGADLRYENLKGAPLEGADLSNADLRGANLITAELSGANLSGADLSGANLTAADLSGANLHRAHLGEAILRVAKLSDADFSDANLSGAVFGETWIATDLTRAFNLEHVHHRLPSHLSQEVLLRATERPWPIQFLRGCGLTNFEIEKIEHVRSIATTPIEFYSCFISYSSKDDKFAVKLHDALQATGIRCWLDKHEVLPGDNIYRKVGEGIRLWDKVLLCCSHNSLTSWCVKDEIVRGLEKEQGLEKERGHEVLAIVPLDLDGYLFNDGCDLEHAPTLRKRHAAKLLGWESDAKVFDEQIAKVVKALRADDLARRSRRRRSCSVRLLLGSNLLDAQRHPASQAVPHVDDTIGALAPLDDDGTARIAHDVQGWHGHRCSKALDDSRTSAAGQLRCQISEATAALRGSSGESGGELGTRGRKRHKTTVGRGLAGSPDG
jgi:hypothetical protein